MKRISNISESSNVDTKKVNLVERSPELPILDLQRISKRDPNDLVELAKQIQSAEIGVKNSACNKLSVIAEQIKFLQSQAKKILEETERDNMLHSAACNFIKIPGTVYHLYRKPSGQSYFSMVSPEEWGASLNSQYCGSFRLEMDSSWTPVEKIEEKQETFEWVQKILNSSAIRQENNMMAIEQLSFQEKMDL